MATNSRKKRRPKFPHELREFFWEYHFRLLNWEEDGDLVIGRILAVGDLGCDPVAAAPGQRQ